MGEIPETREQLRARCVASFPKRYSPWLHLAFPSLVGLGLIAAAILLLRHPSRLELLTIPAIWLFSNMIEWRAHRNILHRRTWYAPVLYDRHTPYHHRIFVREDMAMRSAREFRLILIPAFGILLILAATLPFVVAAWLILGRNVGLLFIATSAGYVLSYEWLHLAYHAPADSLVGRTWLISILRRHHATHHDPALMQRWNFNVTVPLWDWVAGTVYLDPPPGA